MSPLAGDTQCPQFAIVRGAQQEIDHTASRRSGPRKWLRAVTWLIGAGLHPKANQTTQRIAEDLAQRMDYTTGHARYCLDEMVARLGISRASVTRHIKYLRELGALAWVQHGSRTNRLAAMGLKGYAGTATVYAAVIPPVFDHAMGHRIIGTGYTARIIVDLRGQQTTPAPASELVDNPPVENPGSEGRETPSLTVVKEEGQVQVVGGVTTTAQRQRKTSPAPNPRKSSSRKRSTILGNTVTAAGMRLGDKLARAIRRRVDWTRRASHDQLRWVCADMGEQQWTEGQAVRFAVEAGFKHRAGFAWEPSAPHRLIAAELRAHQEQQQADRQMQQDLAQAVAWEDSTAYRQMAALRALLPQPAVEPEPERTDEDRERARLYGWDQWEEVAAHLAEDQDDAIDLYGVRLCKFAINQQARLEGSYA
jgi:AraC-like DNA-binding protein